jgi:hypothetical protein
VDSFYVIKGWTMGRVRILEKRLALRINLHFLFSPLYQEYNIYGYVLGFLFRLFKIITGGIFYLILVLLGAFVYLAWIIIPLFFVYKIFFDGVNLNF